MYNIHGSLSQNCVRSKEVDREVQKFSLGLLFKKEGKNIFVCFYNIIHIISETFSVPSFENFRIVKFIKFICYLNFYFIHNKFLMINCTKIMSNFKENTQVSQHVHYFITLNWLYKIIILIHVYHGLHKRLTLNSLAIFFCQLVNVALDLKEDTDLLCSMQVNMLVRKRKERIVNRHSIVWCRVLIVCNTSIHVRQVASFLKVGGGAKLSEILTL